MKHDHSFSRSRRVTTLGDYGAASSQRRHLAGVIALRLIDSSNYRDCIALTVAPEQQRFVASNVQSLADAYVYPNAEPLALYDGGEMVGIALRFPLGEGGSGDRVPAGATVIGSILVQLMIGARFQGRGYGRALPRSSRPITNASNAPRGPSCCPKQSVSGPAA